jgi:hypothetical protein
MEEITNHIDVIILPAIIYIVILIILFLSFIQKSINTNSKINSIIHFLLWISFPPLIIYYLFTNKSIFLYKKIFKSLISLITPFGVILIIYTNFLFFHIILPKYQLQYTIDKNRHDIYYDSYYYKSELLHEQYLQYINIFLIKEASDVEKLFSNFSSMSGEEFIVDNQSKHQITDINLNFVYQRIRNNKSNFYKSKDISFNINFFDKHLDNVTNWTPHLYNKDYKFYNYFIEKKMYFINIGKYTDVEESIRKNAIEKLNIQKGDRFIIKQLIWNVKLSNGESLTIKHEEVNGP